MSDVQSGATSVSASSTAVGSAVSNPHPGSNVTVPIADTVLSWAVQKNLYNDTLPIIPSRSKVKNGKIQYQLKIKVTLTEVSSGKIVSGKNISIKSNRNVDVVKLSSAISGADGTALITLESFDAGQLSLSVENADISSHPLAINLADAWYESTFLITGYNVCDESDFGGAMTDANGLGDQHRYDFLFSASGVIMQGTGQALNGRYVRFAGMTTSWHRNNRGHRDHIEEPAQVTFAYTTGVQGAYGTVTENHSIAVDAHIIPAHAHVNIDGVGDRYADDKGSAIRDYHIDNFLGAGADVVTTWTHGGINGTQRRVKYIRD